MAEVGNTQGRTEEEAAAAEVAELGHFAFLQTLPGDAIITDEGVYSSRTEMILDRRRREAEATPEEEEEEEGTPPNDNSGGGS